MIKNEKVKRFFECLIPVTACNLKCSYCYVIQDGRRYEKIPKFKYSPEHIGKAMTKERLGGTCYISIAGAGETLLPREITHIIFELLKNGHYVNLTTNGTLVQRFKEISEFPPEYLERLHFAFSYHYVELKKRELLEDFFRNVDLVKNIGSSFLIQLNLCDEYLPYLEELKERCIKETGAAPQLAATRDQRNKKEYRLETNLSLEEYKKKGDIFESPLFSFTMKNFLKVRKEFCYAGDWSARINLVTGEMIKCYNYPIPQDIFKNIDNSIDFEAIGNRICKPFCTNSSHFISLGTIPSIKAPTYGELRNRTEANWYNKRMESFLNTKLSESNKEYTIFNKIKATTKTHFVLLKYKPMKIIRFIKKKLKGTKND